MADDSAPPAARPRWRWFHVAPGALPVALVALLVALEVPQLLLYSLAGADRMEPNDLFSDARELPIGLTAGLHCRTGDVDWFKVSIPAGRALQVESDMLQSGDGTVTLHGAEGVLLAEYSHGAEGIVHVPPALRAQTVSIRVFGGRPAAYQLEAKLIDPGSRLEPNDLPEEAKGLTLGRWEDLRCDGNDWYRITVPAWRSLTATVTGDAGVGLRILDRASIGQLTSAVELPTVTRLEAQGVVRAYLVQVAGKGAYGLDLAPGEFDDALAGKSAPGKLGLVRGELEPNDTREQAPTIGPGHYPDLRCDGQDYYAVEVPAEHTLSVDLGYSQESGGLTLYLWQDPEHLAEAEGEEGEKKAKPKKQERVAFGSYVEGGLRLRHYSRAAGRYFVNVSGSRRPYTMTLRSTQGIPGVPLQPGEFPGLLCTGDDLWRIDVGKDQTLVVEAFILDDDSYIGLELKDRDGVFRGSANSSGEGSAPIRFPSAQDQPVFLRVTGSYCRYQLSVKLEGGMVGIEDYRPRQVTRVGPGVYPGRALARDTYFEVPLAAGQELGAKVRFLSAVADVDLEVLDARGRPVVTSAGDGDEESVRFKCDQAQSLFVHVFTFTPAPTSYELTVTVDGATTAAAEPVSPGGVTGIRCSGYDGHRVSLEAGQRLAVKVAFAHAQGDLDLSLRDPEGREVAASTSESNGELIDHVARASGEYTIRVHGAQSVYDLFVEVTDE